jgi:hypothetical protein
VFHHVEGIIAGISRDFDEGHAVSTALVEVEMRTPQDIAKSELRFAAGTSGARGLTQTSESDRTHEYKRLDSSAKAFVFERPNKPVGTHEVICRLGTMQDG